MNRIKHFFIALWRYCKDGLSIYLPEVLLSVLPLGLFSFLLIILLPYMAGTLYLAQRYPKAQKWILYLGKSGLYLALTFIAVNMIGGMSMAVSDGVAGSYRDRLLQSYIPMVFKSFLFLHILILPSTAYGLWRLKRPSASKPFPQS